MEATAGQFLVVLGIFVVGAAVVGLVGRLVRMPTIISYLLAGLGVAPLLGWLFPQLDHHTPLETISEMGIVLLLFLVGVELSFERLRQVGKVALAAGVGQVVFTATGGFLLSWLLGFEPMASLFIATALTFSSTVVVVKLLDQKNELESLYGRIAVGIFLVQDLVVIVILTLLAGLGGSEELSTSAVLVELGKAFGGVAVLSGVALLASRYVLPRTFGWAARVPRVLYMWSLAWCFGFVLAAELMGLSLEIGAFLAGLSIAQLDVAEDLRRRIHPLMNFFVAIFFVSLGVQTELGAAANYWLEAVVLSLFVLIGNPLIFMWIIARYGYSQRTAFLSGVTVAQISEFSFIFAAMGVGMGAIGEDVLSVITMVGVATISLSAYMILYNEHLYERFDKTGLLRIFGAAETDDEEPAREHHRGHIVVVGMNELGRRIAGRLHEAGQEVVAIDTDPGKLAGLDCHTMIGDVDFMSTLQQADIGQAKLAVSALRIEAANKLFAYRLRQMDVPCAVYGIDHWISDQLREAGAGHVIAAKHILSDALADELSPAATSTR